MCSWMDAGFKFMRKRRHQKNPATRSRRTTALGMTDETRGWKEWADEADCNFGCNGPAYLRGPPCSGAEPSDDFHSERDDLYRNAGEYRTWEHPDSRRKNCRG